MEILNSKIILKNVEFKLEIDDEFELNCYEHIFSNIMMILIDNSLDSFQSNTLGNQIKISINRYNNHYKIEYIDNAGGIKIKPIEKIFEYFISSKDGTNTKGHGMGLAIAKMLVEDRLKGKISVKNSKDGAIFRIILKVIDSVSSTE
jgi:signal transduction histidine kinase